MWIFSLSLERGNCKAASAVLSAPRPLSLITNDSFSSSGEEQSRSLTKSQMVIYLVQIVDLTVHKLLE